jgi:hypothetical protein
VSYGTVYTVYIYHIMPLTKEEAADQKIGKTVPSTMVFVLRIDL